MCIISFSGYDVMAMEYHECNSNNLKSENEFCSYNESERDFDDCTIESLACTQSSKSMIEFSYPIKETVDFENTKQERDVFNKRVDSVNSNLMIGDLQLGDDNLEYSGCSFSEIRDKGLSHLSSYDSSPILKSININGKRVLILRENAVVYFNGFITIHILLGAVEILGHLISVNSAAMELYSPRGASFLYIKTSRMLNTSNEINTNKLHEVNIKDSELKNILSGISEYAAVILMEKYVKLNIAYLEKHIAQQIFPKQDEEFRCVFRHKPFDWNVIKISRKWEILANGISQTSKVFLSGGKGVGKSTLLRYLTNSLLMQYEAVKVIDLDPGQPEFTVSGCISACTIRFPIFGPNFTHIIKPDK